jgi:hypothetical protein
MPTIEELGRKVKAKYPGKYDDMSDAEVGRKVKAQYPAAYDDYVETGLSVLGSQSIIPHVDYSHYQQKFENLTKDLIHYYNPKQGRLSAWWNRGKAESRVKLLQVLNEEQRLVLEQAAMAEERAMQSERNRIEFEKFIATHVIELMELRLSASIIDHALAMGVDRDTAVYVNRVRVLDQLELEKLERQSFIHTREYRDKKQADNEALAEGYRIDHENITRTQQEPLELIDRATERLFKLYDQRAELENSTDNAKAHKLAQLNKNIKIAEAALDAEQARLIQAEAGETKERFTAPDDSGGVYQETDTSINE